MATSPHIAVAAFAALATFQSFATFAQVERSGGETQKFMQQYQQIAAEKTALQAQVAQLKKDLEASKADLAAGAKDREALKARASGAAASAAAVAQLTASKEAAEKNLETYKQRMSELVARFRETAVTLKEVEADRNKLRQEVGERNAAFDKCAESNVKLYEISNEVLDRYEHVGLFTKASEEEPFTRITRTRIENLVDEYRESARENRIKRSAPLPQPGTAAPETPPPAPAQPTPSASPLQQKDP
jgi:chromosome segregation ATPase